MTATEYREALAALDLSQVGAAKLFKVNARTSRRWALGEMEIPEAVAIALRLMVGCKKSPKKSPKSGVTGGISD